MGGCLRCPNHRCKHQMYISFASDMLSYSNQRYCTLCLWMLNNRESYLQKSGGSDWRKRYSLILTKTTLITCNPRELHFCPISPGFGIDRRHSSVLGNKSPGHSDLHIHILNILILHSCNNLKKTYQSTCTCHTHIVHKDV